VIRIAVQTCDYQACAHFNCSAEVALKTFDIEAPELEAHLREYVDRDPSKSHTLWHRTVAGVEAIGPVPAILKGYAKSAVDDARSHLGAALMQMLPSDNQIIMQHVRSAYTALGGDPMDHHAQREFLTTAKGSD
jgi:hypothetical protein